MINRKSLYLIEKHNTGLKIGQELRSNSLKGCQFVIRLRRRPRLRAETLMEKDSWL